MNHKEHLNNITLRCNILIEDIVEEGSYTEAFYGDNIISEFDNFVLLSQKDMRDRNIPTDASIKDIRLALDMIHQRYPLYKRADLQTKLDFIYDIFNFDITLNDLLKLKTFKKITKKARIVIINNKPKLVSVIRYRNPKHKIYL